MKITLCGSIKFAKEIVEIYRKLKELGHEPLMHDEMFKIANGTLTGKTYWEISENGTKRKCNLIKWWHDCIKSGDAILVCNFDNGRIKNYTGGNVLMEIGFAYVNDKKIFLLNPIPKELSSDELKVMVDVILDGDLSKIQ